MYVTQLSIKNSQATPASLAHFLKKHTDRSNYPKTLSYYLEKAKKLIAGESYQYDYKLDIPENNFVYVTLVEVLSEDEKYWKEVEEKQQYYADLLVKGANGDSQAAVEFCKAYNEGKYRVYAYATA